MGPPKITKKGGDVGVYEYGEVGKKGEFSERGIPDFFTGLNAKLV